MTLRIIRDYQEDEGPSNTPVHCPTCGAKTVEYRNSISQSQVRALRQLKVMGGSAAINELGLTNSAYSAFAKLKYWDLIERTSPGHWKLTSAGERFLAGGVLRATAVSYRNRLLRHEGAWVTVEEISPFARGHDEHVADQIPHEPEPPEDQPA